MLAANASLHAENLSNPNFFAVHKDLCPWSGCNVVATIQSAAAGATSRTLFSTRIAGGAVHSRRLPSGRPSPRSPITRVTRGSGSASCTDSGGQHECMFLLQRLRSIMH